MSLCSTTSLVGRDPHGRSLGSLSCKEFPWFSREHWSIWLGLRVGHPFTRLFPMFWHLRLCHSHFLGFLYCLYGGVDEMNVASGQRFYLSENRSLETLSIVSRATCRFSYSHILLLPAIMYWIFCFFYKKITCF
jgi:hypothetical protein